MLNFNKVIIKLLSQSSQLLARRPEEQKAREDLLLTMGPNSSVVPRVVPKCGLVPISSVPKAEDQSWLSSTILEQEVHEKNWDRVPLGWGVGGELIESWEFLHTLQ